MATTSQITRAYQAYEDAERLATLTNKRFQDSRKENEAADAEANAAWAYYQKLLDEDFDK